MGRIGTGSGWDPRDKGSNPETRSGSGSKAPAWCFDPGRSEWLRGRAPRGPARRGSTLRLSLGRSDSLSAPPSGLWGAGCWERVFSSRCSEIRRRDHPSPLLPSVGVDGGGLLRAAPFLRAPLGPLRRAGGRRCPRRPALPWSRPRSATPSPSAPPRKRAPPLFPFARGSGGRGRATDPPRPAERRSAPAAGGTD